MMAGTQNIPPVTQNASKTFSKKSTFLSDNLKHFRDDDKFKKNF